MSHSLPVTDVMQTDFLGIEAGESIGSTATLLLDHRENVAIVVDGGLPVGVVTARSLLAPLREDREDESIESIMTEAYATVDDQTSVGHAADRLLRADVEAVIVLDGNEQAVGTITAPDVLSATSSMLSDDPDASFHGAESGSTASLSEQGVCEACGRLADELSEVDGMLICADCQEL